MGADLIPGIVHALEQHGRIPIDGLARLLDAPADEVRHQILAFNDVELDGLILDALFVVEPEGGWPDEGPDPEPSDRDLVCFAPAMTGGDLGLAHADAATLGPLLAAADLLRMLEPENLELAAAVDVLRTSLVTNVSGSAGYRARTARILHHAAAQQRRVRVTYARAWTPGVSTRIIDPYRVVSTSRGYEVDAGPLDDDGRPRTYLLSGMRQIEVLDDHFPAPPGLAEALEVNRQLTPVSGVAPHSVMWAIRHWSERVDQRASDTDDVAFTAWVLPPVPDRVALMCLVAGPGVDLDDPVLARRTAQRAAELAAHHGL